MNDRAVECSAIEARDINFTTTAGNMIYRVDVFTNSQNSVFIFYSLMLISRCGTCDFYLLVLLINNLIIF